LDIQLNSAHSRLAYHPLPKLLRHGIPVTLSTDDPTMFKTTLLDEYSNAFDMGLTRDELLLLNRNAFQHAFLPEAARQIFFARLPSSSASGSGR
jgi:adenosine deaminase